MSDDELCASLALRCRECGWSGGQRGYKTHTTLTHHVLVEVLRPMCRPNEEPCRACTQARKEAAR